MGFTITSGLEPKDRQEGSHRVAFFSSAAASVCSKALQAQLERCRRGEFGDAVQAATATPFNSKSYGSAIKSLASIFIYLTMVDQGAQAPGWLQDFLGTSARALDRIVDGPSVRDILQLHEFVSGYDVCSDAALDVCRALNIAQVAREFTGPLRHFLETSQELRCQMLQFALTQPSEALDRKLEELRL